MRGAFLKRETPLDKIMPSKPEVAPLDTPWTIMTTRAPAVLTIVFSLLKVFPALRSREARRLKENQIAMRAAYLEKQVIFIVFIYLFYL